MLGRASTRSFDAALRDLRSERHDVRESAARDLVRHADDHRAEVVKALTAALADENADVRATAATGLGDVKAREAVDPLIAATEDSHDFVRQMALSALAELSDERALPVFSTALGSEAPSDRFQAVMGIAKTSHDANRVREVLLHATRDEDHLVRHIALRLAEERGDGTAVEPVFVDRARALLDDDSDVVRVAAAVLLGRMGRRDGAEVLSQVVSRTIITSEHDDEAAAIELCGELGLKAAVDALRKRAFGRVILLSSDPFAWHARVALAALGDAKAVKWVLDELGAWTRERRTLAVAAAGRARVAEARGRLEAMAGDEARADPEAVSEALARLEDA